MAQTSGFFNALRTDGVLDRTYNAEHYSDNLAVVIGNGVLRSENDDLKVTASGMVVSVGVGRGWINGHFYKNDAVYSFPATSAPISGQRYDRIVLRLDNNLSARKISLVYVTGEAGNEPKKPAPIRENNVHDLVLADILVKTNSTSLIVTDKRADKSVCGWVYSTAGDNSFFESLDENFDTWFKEKKNTLSSVTLFKKYDWRTVLTSASDTAVFSIPQYNVETCFLEVYVNGILKTKDYDYTLNGSIVKFSSSLIAGTEIEVKCFKSIDGTGIMTVADEITQLQNAVADMQTANEYNYFCNGVNDNSVLTLMARAWLNGGVDYGCKKINVIGNFGFAGAAKGSGTSASPYAFFNFDADSNRRLIVDFTRCSQLSPTIENGTLNYIFSGKNMKIVGANVVINNTATDTSVRIFDATQGELIAEDCRFWITSYKDSRVGQTGTFTNCRASVANSINNCYCFLPFTESLLRINGGEYYAYSGSSTAQSAVVGQSSANAVSILNGVNAPSLTRSGYYQTNSVLQWAGGGVLSCTDLVSDLPLIVVAGISNIRGTIAKNKAGNL